MKKYLIIAAVCVLIIGEMLISSHALSKATKERDRYKANTEALLTDVQQYRVRDSLNAAQIGALTISLNEYETARANDWALIKDLQTKNREMQSVLTTQTRTIAELRGTFRDSIVFVDRFRIDTLKCLTISNPYYWLSGCIGERGEFNGTMQMYDTLTAVVSVKHKRFLGFLWKTSKIKDKHCDIVSRSPYTYINNIEYFEID